MRKHKNNGNNILTGIKTINHLFKRLYLLLDMSNFKYKMPSEYSKKLLLTNVSFKHNQDGVEKLPFEPSCSENRCHISKKIKWVKIRIINRFKK